MRSVPCNGVVHLAVWGRDLDCESRQFEEDEGLPQPLHQVNAGSVQATAVEAENP